MKTICIIGGTGFLGRSVAAYLKDLGYKVRVIARNRPKVWDEVIPFYAWNGLTHDTWHEALKDTDIFINFAGRSVNCIKTPNHCDEILRSRVLSTRLIGEALAKLEIVPELWIQMSTAHIYGDPPVAICDESSPTGYGLAPEVGKAWEKAFYDAKPDKTREIVLRTGFVLGNDGGAYLELSKIVKMGLGGTVASGNQGMSWIHIDDFNSIIQWSINNAVAEGIYNVSSPNPVSNKAFMNAFRKALKMPIGLPAPEWITRFGAHYVFKTDPELAIYGRYVIPKRLLTEGFSFKYTDALMALRSMNT